ncbi:hypothetical protein ACWGH2_40855, partial [Streptomyces sp. NPDC054871]
SRHEHGYPHTDPPTNTAWKIKPTADQPPTHITGEQVDGQRRGGSASAGAAAQPNNSLSFTASTGCSPL